MEVDIDLTPIGVGRFLAPGTDSRTFRLSDPDALSLYFEKSNGIGAVFSYMTSIIFLREKWNAVENDQELIGTAYHHVYKLLSFRNHGCTLKYIKDPLVISRMGNDSFAGTSLAKRVTLDINAYSIISKKLFHDDPEIKRKFDAILEKEVLIHHLNSMARIIFLKVYSDPSDWKTMTRKINDLYGFHFLLCLADLIPDSPIWDKAIQVLRKIFGRTN
jgi:abequosyltransferase